MAKVQGESQRRNGGRSYCNEKCAISVLSLSNRLAEADPEIGHDVQTIKRRLANFTHLGRQSPGTKPQYEFASASKVLQIAPLQRPGHRR
jgi:hypothetical protein